MLAAIHFLLSTSWLTSCDSWWRKTWEISDGNRCNGTETCCLSIDPRYFPVTKRQLCMERSQQWLCFVACCWFIASLLCIIHVWAGILLPNEGAMGFKWWLNLLGPWIHQLYPSLKLLKGCSSYHCQWTVPINSNTRTCFIFSVSQRTHSGTGARNCFGTLD